MFIDKEQEAVKVRDQSGYISTQLEVIYANGGQLREINEHLKFVDLTPQQIGKLVLDSPFGEDPAIRGSIVLFGYKV